MADYTIPNLNETVAAEIKPPSFTPSNPMEQMSGMMGIQNQMNQINLFQQSMAAKRQAGAIMAAAPDMDTAMKNLSQDPQVMGFMPEILNTVRQADLTNQQLLQTKQTMGDTGLHAVMQALPSGLTDSTSFDNAIKARLAPMPKQVQEQLAPAVANIKSSLFDGLPEDPAQRASAYKQRLNALWIGSGMTAEQIAGLTGTAKQTDAGGYIQPQIAMPAALGGGVVNTPGAIPKTLAPTPITGPYGPGGAQKTQVIGGGLPGGGYSPLPGNPLTSGQSGGNGATSARSSAPASGNSLTGPSMVQSQYNEHRGADTADYEKSLDDRVGNGATLRKNVGEVVDAMKTAETGGGANAYMKMGQALQALGVKSDTVDKWANGSLAASQVVDKIALQNSMSQLKQQLTGVGGSRLNAQEFVAYLNKNPNLLTDPKAALQIFNLWNQFYDRDKTEQTMFDKFKSGQPTGDKSLDKATGGNNDLSRWPALWNQSDYMSSFAPGGVISGAGVKGISSGYSKEDQALLDKYLKAKK